MTNSTSLDPPNRVAGDEGFKDKTLLVTGASGFLGKVFVEKLLRTCPLVKRVYVLVRPRKGKTPQGRVKEIFAGPLFELLRKTHGEDIFKKVTVIEGDVSEVDLGISKQDRQLLTEEVQIVYHMAATVRFDDPLKQSVLLNTRGTKFMIDLAKECRNLIAFAHVSTAYAHPHEKVLYEKTYPPPADPHKIIQLVELLDDDMAEVISKKLKGTCPNTYTFTKAMAEALVTEQMDSLPIMILRPSVVVPAWLSPVKGWTDNWNGPGGLLVGAGKGVIRTMYCDPDFFIDLLPVDVAANGLLISVFFFMQSSDQRVYNIVTSNSVKLTWQQLIDYGRHTVETQVPFNWVAWYPGGSIKKSRLHHNICMILFHYIPAILVDTVIVLTGNKPILWKVQQKVTKGFELLEYYANNQWHFNIDQVQEKLKTLNETEKKTYKLDDEGFDIHDFLYHCVMSIRRYMLKEPDDTIPAAKRHMKVMWAVDKLTKLLFIVGIIYIITKYVFYPIMGLKF